MVLTDVAILALIQGVTEFLPVSSSGHLVIARLFLGISDAEGTSFDAFLHIGTLLAVLLYYRRTWWGLVRGVFVNDEEGSEKRELAAKLALATVPAAIVGYAMQGAVAILFRTPTTVAVGLLLTAGALLFGDALSRRVRSVYRASYKDSTYIGLVQVLALLPGVSRSGVTIAAGRWRGLDRKQAATFSFLLSAPIIAGAGLSSFAQLLEGGSFGGAQLVVGFLVSFLSGYAAIYVLLKMVERVSFLPFAIYLILLSGVLLLS